MTRFKTLSMAALLALAAGTAMSGGAFAAVAGGGSAGDGGPGGSIGFDAPALAINLPGTPQARPGQPELGQQSCRFELLRGHFCEGSQR
jgi:hypothetical protein